MRKDVKGIVDKLIKKYGTRDPFRLADALGVVVQFSDIHLSGMYTPLKRQRVILLDARLKNEENNRYLNAVMAHELGHAVLHRETRCYFFSDKTFFLKSKPETEANTFAAELLVSDEDVLEHQNYTADQLARITGYDQKLIELKMKNYNSDK